MCDHEDVEYGFHATFERAGHVAIKHGTEGLLFLPLWMLGGQCLHTIQGKGQLVVNWLFRPERAIVVKNSDAVQGWDKVRLPSAVTRSTKWRIDFFAGPSFHEGRGSVTILDCFMNVTSFPVGFPSAAPFPFGSGKLPKSRQFYSIHLANSPPLPVPPPS